MKAKEEVIVEQSTARIEQLTSEIKELKIASFDVTEEINRLTGIAQQIRQKLIDKSQELNQLQAK